LQILYDMPNGPDLRRILNFIVQHAGILVSPSPKRYAFAHRVFQEYLCAAYICKTDPDLNTLAAMLTGGLAGWEQVLRLIPDITAFSGETKTWVLVDLLVELSNNKQKKSDGPRFLSIAAEIIIDQGLGSPERRLALGALRNFKKAATRRLPQVSALTPTMRESIGRALSRVNDDRAGVGLTKVGDPDIAWCTIPSGSCRIGSVAEQLESVVQQSFGVGWEFEREKPEFGITIPEFQIARYPVTVIQFGAFVSSNDGYRCDKWWTEEGLRSRDIHRFEGVDMAVSGNQPRTAVNWYEASAFCGWLGSRSGSDIFLPSEVQWEKAARGNQNRVFPWGDNPNAEMCNVKETGLGRICAVGVFPDSAQWGKNSPQDMVGGVWEWCTTIFEDAKTKKKILISLRQK
jgi:formylglycine-generating enzyme required for sulfatase activity